MNVGKKKNEFCFEAFKRSSVVYVRQDIAQKAGYVQKNTPKPVPKPTPKPVQGPVTMQVVKKNTNEEKKRKLENLKKKIQLRK
jgi:hypothetical protein